MDQLVDKVFHKKTPGGRIVTEFHADRAGIRGETYLQWWDGGWRRGGTGTEAIREFADEGFHSRPIRFREAVLFGALLVWYIHLQYVRVRKRVFVEAVGIIVATWTVRIWRVCCHGYLRHLVL